MIINNQLIHVTTVTMSSVSVWGYGDAAGLQCWDSAGRIVVDLSDFSIRYIGSASVTLPLAKVRKISLSLESLRMVHSLPLSLRGWT
jgi:hypothetical protein